MLASSRKPCGGASPRRRAKSPALHCGRKRVLTRKFQPTVRPTGGPMKSSAPTQRGGVPQPSSARHACRPRFRRPCALHCRAGVHARRGALRRPGRILARQGTAPLSRLTPTAPLPGEPFGWQFFESLPCKGLRSRAPQTPGGCPSDAAAGRCKASARCLYRGLRQPGERDRPGRAAFQRYPAAPPGLPRFYSTARNTALSPGMVRVPFSSRAGPPCWYSTAFAVWGQGQVTVRAAGFSATRMRLSPAVRR